MPSLKRQPTPQSIPRLLTISPHLDDIWTHQHRLAGWLTSWLTDDSVTWLGWVGLGQQKAEWGIQLMMVRIERISRETGFKFCHFIQNIRSVQVVCSFFSATKRRLLFIFLYLNILFATEEKVQINLISFTCCCCSCCCFPYHKYIK